MCILCSEFIKQKYYIFKRDGGPGAAKSIVENFLSVSFAPLKENFGAHVCIACKKNVQKCIGHQATINDIVRKLEGSSQTLQAVSSQKRVTPGRSPFKTRFSPRLAKKSRTVTPTTSPIKGKNGTPRKTVTPQRWTASPLSTPTQRVKKSERVTSSKKQLSFSSLDSSFYPSHISTPHPSSSISVHPILHEDLTTASFIETVTDAEPDQSTEDDISKLANSDKSHATTRTEEKGATKATKNPARRKTMLFRSVRIARDMFPIAISLKDGSVRHALTKIHAKFPQVFYKYVASIVKRESQAMGHHNNSHLNRDNAPEDLEKINLDDMTKTIQETCPLAWSVACTVASNYQRKYKYKDRYVLTAFLILLSSRSQNINTFQMANSLAMYRFDINKEGIQFLSSLGVTVSHTTLHKKLHEIEKKVVSDLHTLKVGLEHNSVRFIFVLIECAWVNILRFIFVLIECAWVNLFMSMSEFIAVPVNTFNLAILKQNIYILASI
jgi:hypothetical protein